MREPTIFRLVEEAGVTEPLVRAVMRDFYSHVRNHAELRPVFVQAIGKGDWDAHIEKIVLFWLTAFRIQRGYPGRNFMPAHLKHAHIQIKHIAVWLELFESVLRPLCTQAQADAFMAIANAMGENLEIGFRKRDGAASAV